MDGDATAPSFGREEPTGRLTDLGRLAHARLLVTKPRALAIETRPPAEPETP